MPPRLTEAAVFDLLRTRYPKASCALLPQVADRTGAATRRADAIAMQLWPSRGLLIEGFEIKVSRGDWKRELEDPAKQESVGRYCDAWWIVAPAGIVLDGELPVAWGLLEVVYDGTGKPALRETVKAPKNPDVIVPGKPFIASLMRSLQEHESPAAEREAEREKLRAELVAEATKLAQTSIEKQTADLRKELTRFKNAVAAFERTAGVQIDTWNPPNAAALATRWKAVVASDVILTRTANMLENAKAGCERLGTDTSNLIEMIRSYQA